MADKWTSIFAEDGRSNPYYVVSGMTTDNMISDEMTVSDVKVQLHRHLLEQGFDAVIFFDSVHMIHFYDAKSSFVMRNLALPTPAQLEAALRGREEGSAAPAPQRTVLRHFGSGRRAQQENANWGRVWEMNMEQMTVLRAYKKLADLLRCTHLRCAVVFCDNMAMQLDSGSESVQARYNALYAPLENRAENRNVIVFMVSSEAHNAIADVLTPAAQAPDLANFFSTYVVPKLAEDEVGNYLRVPPPPAGEIRSLFNMMRITGGLQVDMTQLEQIARHLEAYCSRQWVSMANLYNLVANWQRKHEGQPFGMEEAAQLTGMKTYRSPEERLEALTGLGEVKRYFRRLKHLCCLQSPEEAPQPSRLWINAHAAVIRGHGLNLALLGNPGTGKSTVASIVGELYRAYGLLPSGSVTEVSATELTGARALHEQVRRAMGGVLLIEEAYALMNRPDGQDVIDALVADMGAYAGQFAVVLCGYREQTLQLMEANDGLRRRIPAENTILLPDYTAEELKQVFLSMMAQDDSVDGSFLMEEEQQAVLDNIFRGWVGEAGPGWGNAGEAENLLTLMKTRCAERLGGSLGMSASLGGGKMRLTLQDFPENMQTWASDPAQDLAFAYRELESLTGLNNVKRAIYEIARTIQLGGGTVREPGFYVFQGPPGTGKSMMAEKMGLIFQKLGVIKRRTPYVVTARKLLEPPAARRPGEFADPRRNGLQDALALSENGVLFIDEAHQLADSDAGRGLLRELVPLMENAEFRRKHCIILAGYTIEMERLFAADSGLGSRFPRKNRIKFSNYTASELTAIMKGMAEKDGETPDEAFLRRTEVALSLHLSSPKPNFGNARFIRNEYLPAAKEKRNARVLRQKLGVSSGQVMLTKEQFALLTHEDLHTLTAEDIPSRPTDFAALAGPAEALPEEPLTAARMTEQLFDKEEAQAFIRQIVEAVRSGEGYHGGINYTVCGPMGCGKETLISAIANVLAENGLTDSNEVYCLTEGELVAGYVGQTAGKTRQAVTAAQGATVVLAQPSALLLRNNDNDNSFGPQAIAEFFSCMGRFGANTSFVLMDSEAGMEAFLKAYPAARSMFGRHFEFEDLRVESMQAIFRLKTRNMLFAEDLQPLMDDFVANWVSDRGGLGTAFLSWGNGEEIDKLLQKLRENWALRKGETRPNQRRYPCPVITRDMFPRKMHKYLRPVREQQAEVLRSMDKEIGLPRVKEAIRAIEVQMRRTAPDRVMPGHYCFIGNPGVGKTRMAKKLGSVLQATKVLRQGMVITRTAREMMEQLADFDKLLRVAKENVLFIDEAHQLADSGAGVAVVKKLLTVLEDTEVMRHVCIVLAGYPREMRRLFALDAGLQSRFDAENSILIFDDYTPDELEELLVLFGRQAAEEEHFSTDRAYDLTLPENAAFMAEARRALEYAVSRQDPNYGNARFVRNLLRDTLVHQMLRLDAAHPGEASIPESEWAVLLPEDLPQQYRAPRQAAHGSSRQCIPAAKVRTAAAGPILTENMTARTDEIQRSVLLLEARDAAGTVVGYGTGFVITEEGHVLTCNHVVAHAETVRARLYYPGIIGGERWFEDCEILRPTVGDNDMALIRIHGANGFVPLPLRSPDAPVTVAEDMVICGYPFGMDLRLNEHFSPSMFFGKVASIQGQGTEHETVYVDCSAKQGDSGAPVISRVDGRVIGILRGSKTSQAGKLVEEINFFTPIRFAWQHFVNA